MVTFYFQHKILKELDVRDPCALATPSHIETRVIEFIEKYGSYLHLYESLKAASEHFSAKVIQKLLDVSCSDPLHNESMKLFSKNTTYIPYEPKVFSCLLCRLSFFDRKGKERGNVLAMFVAAYPDLKPWQIRTMLCLNTKYDDIVNLQALQDTAEDDIIFYYEYLSLLMESYQVARLDKTLVKEWCLLSTSPEFSWDIATQRRNFLCVASKSNEEYKFFRDIPFLINASHVMRDHMLTLSLATELFSTFDTGYEDIILTDALDKIHDIAKDSLTRTDTNDLFDALLMQDILSFFQRVSLSTNSSAKYVINISTELNILLDLCQQQAENVIDKEIQLLQLIAKMMSSTDTLNTLSDRSVDHIPKGILIEILRTCLKKGDEDVSDDDVPNALIRLRKIRSTFKSSQGKCSAPLIWSSLLNGVNPNDIASVLPS